MKIANTKAKVSAGHAFAATKVAGGDGASARSLGSRGKGGTGVWVRSVALSRVGERGREIASFGRVEDWTITAELQDTEKR